MPAPELEIDRALASLSRLAGGEPALATEAAQARRSFFADAPAPAAPDTPAGRLAERRFQEWFLLERPAEALDAIPVIAFGERIDVGIDPELADRYASLINSHAGIFEVTDVQMGEGFWVRDLFGRGQYPLSEAAASQSMSAGDLLVGRLFPVDEGTYEASSAASCFRSPELNSAIQRDVERVRRDRRGPLRMQQSELERMFFGAGAADLSASTVGEARRVLAAGGLDDAAVEAVLAHLAAAPFDPLRWAHGPDDEFGQILDRLAFETAVDLDTARRALLGAWPFLAGGQSPAPAGAGAAGPIPADDVAAAIRDFDDGRAAGQDLDALFRELETRLGLEPEGLPDDEGDLPDFPGVVAAMIEEYLWDVERQHGADVAHARSGLRALGRAVGSLGVFENLSTADLLQFATLWVPESGEFADADEARRLVDGLVDFAAWARRCHQLDQLADAEEVLSGLREDLPRAQSVNARLAEPANAAEPVSGEILRVVRAEPDGRCGLSTKAGELRSAELEPAVIAPSLQPEDRLRAIETRPGVLRVLRCYPRQVADIEPA